MATLKEHQAAMVDLLANGSGIPASASRLAHAMHDVLEMLLSEREVERCGALIDRLIVERGEGGLPERPFLKCNDATTPGLNDKALSKREKALKTDSPAKWPTPAEQRVKELENTCTQLRKQSAKYRATITGMKADIDSLKALVFACEHGAEPEQAGCRKEDTDWATAFQNGFLKNAVDMACEAIKTADTQVCAHERTAWDHEIGDSQEIEVCLDCHKVISMRPV